MWHGCFCLVEHVSLNCSTRPLWCCHDWGRAGVAVGTQCLSHWIAKLSCPVALTVGAGLQVWHLEDSEERGIGHLGGLAFRRWGDIGGSGPVQARNRCYAVHA